MALRIKSSVDLKELEKYGFNKYNRGYLKDKYVLEFTMFEFIVVDDNKVLKFYEDDELYEMYAGHKIFDVIYDLIKDDLVEKVKE